MKKQKIDGPSLRLKKKKSHTTHTAKRAAARKAVRQSRPLHRHIALNPLSVFGLLCVGVLLATFTMSAAAGTITVTATYPAPPLTQPAVITSPVDGTQTSEENQVVEGTCPDSSYVDVLDNGNFQAEETCTGETFQVQFDLTSGTNYLQAQDYNVTNSPGPTSTGVTVTYTPPPPPPTPPPTQTQTTQVTTAVPQQLVVTQVDLNVPLDATPIPDISYQPTFAGIAPPFSKIYIVVHSDVFTCNTVTDAEGYWSCTLPADLPAAIHHVDVSAVTPQGTNLTYPQFEVRVTGQPPAPAGPPAPFDITSSYTYAIYSVGQVVSYDIHVIGGAPPYAFTVLWGDGQSSTIVRQDASDFTISHKYGWVNASLKVETVKVQGIDTDGQSSALQFSAPVRNPAYHSAVANTTHSIGLWGVFGALKPWLWLIWPGYLIVILLVISFWLGEREEMRRLMASSRISVGGKHHHPHFHH